VRCRQRNCCRAAADESPLAFPEKKLNGKHLDLWSLYKQARAPSTRVRAADAAAGRRFAVRAARRKAAPRAPLARRLRAWRGTGAAGCCACAIRVAARKRRAWRPGAAPDAPPETTRRRDR
jgi:hypothetical protein